MIKSFADKRTAAVFAGLEVRGLARPLQKAARRKLAMLEAASSLAALQAVPGNRLEALRGDRKGQYSIRVNRQWRLCFRWEAGHAWDVELVDYHG
ncbi:MAG: type II toxin-antitoxin system RelE/ParE family toxin [Burkholderiales bacterium]|nr:type II toxin-antitoxin system RelE/ParE family toxin [Burkholderiales bacterium]